MRGRPDESSYHFLECEEAQIFLCIMKPPSLMVSKQSFVHELFGLVEDVATLFFGGISGLLEIIRPLEGGNSIFKYCFSTCS